MALNDWIVNRVHRHLFKIYPLSSEFKEEFKKNSTELNFQRAQFLVVIVFVINFTLLWTDFLNFQKGVWALNFGYKLLFYAHLAWGFGMLLFMILARFMKYSHTTKLIFILLTSIYHLVLAAIISGGVDQILHGQITVYILAVFALSVLFYFNPHISLFLYLSSFVIFAVELQHFQPNYDVLRGHLINGVMLVIIAWFFSVNLYRLRIRDLLHQFSLEDTVAQRTLQLEELNCQLEEEIFERQRLDDEMTQFFKAIPDLICFLSFDSYLTRVNCAFRDLLGYTKEDVKYTSIFELVYPEDRVTMDQALRQCIETRCTVRKLNIRLQCKNGEYILVEWTAVPDFERQVIFAVGRDMTEQKQDQEKAYRLASIVESTDDGIIGMSPDGIVQYWNPGAERIYGYTAEEIVGKPILTIITDERTNELEQIFSNVLQGEKISHFDTERKHKDGRVLEVSLTVSPIKDNSGNVIGMSTIVRDVSNHKRMEKELTRLDRLNLIGEMAASISHEVRNPMTTVRGFLQLLYNKEGCGTYQPYYDLMIEELDRANSILTEFLSISRTKMTERRQQNLNSIVRSMLPLIGASAVASNKSIDTDLKEVPDLLLDDKEIRQVILNLARNGLEAMEEGGTVTIRTYEVPKAGEVVLEVQDEGYGISPELLERLGTPFLTTKNEGTGLGLAVCFGIASRHNARIDVESGESGSIFRLKFKQR